MSSSRGPECGNLILCGVVNMGIIFCTLILWLYAKTYVKSELRSFQVLGSYKGLQGIRPSLKKMTTRLIIKKE